MKPTIFWCLTISTLALSRFSFAQGAVAAPSSSTTQLPVAGKQSALPPLPTGVTELKWNEFFTMPVGPMGLELTEKIKSLNGKKVRLLGYMVRREEPFPGVLLLTPSPESIEEDEAGFSDLPPQMVRVIVPQAKDKQIPYTPRPLLLVGTLSVGNQEEPREKGGGNISLFRLTLETTDETAPATARP